MIYDRQFRVFDSRMAVLVTPTVVKQHVPRGRERERERKTSGLRRIVENKAMGLDFFLLFLKFWIMDELRLLTMNIFEI